MMTDNTSIPIARIETLIRSWPASKFHFKQMFRVSVFCSDARTKLFVWLSFFVENRSPWTILATYPDNIIKRRLCIEVLIWNQRGRKQKNKRDERVERCLPLVRVFVCVCAGDKPIYFPIFRIRIDQVFLKLFLWQSGRSDLNLKNTLQDRAFKLFLWWKKNREMIEQDPSTSSNAFNPWDWDVSTKLSQSIKLLKVEVSSDFFCVFNRYWMCLLSLSNRVAFGVFVFTFHKARSVIESKS